MQAEKINHEQERSNDMDKILNSSHPRKVVMGGPGTGKSYLFKEAIKRRKKEGKKEFLAITFVGKLCDRLADDLAGLTKTKTLHGFARSLVLDECGKGWKYCPQIDSIIKEDLILKEKKFEVGSVDYEERTKYYKAIGDKDVVYYAIKICERDNGKIPNYDLILIDEFQDFNEIEAKFVDLLATQNEVLIVGDDDQALYKFKGSFSKFIRDKFNNVSNDDFESHFLRYCSRCTKVIIDTFHKVVGRFKAEGKFCGRIEKEYIYYPPGKDKDSALNQEILLLKDIPLGLVPTKIKGELSKIVAEQEIKSVLVIGEGRTCKRLLSRIAKYLKEFGFKNVRCAGQQRDTFSFKSQLINAYKILASGENDILAWRLLINELEKECKEEILLNHYSDADGFINALPEEFKKLRIKNARTLERILTSPKSGRDQIASSSIEALLREITEEKKEEHKVFIEQLVDKNHYLPRPLVNLDITVCTILGAKGLGADIVFLIGFDQGKLPIKKDIEDSEIYQFLVALTRARKRVYLVNTVGNSVSKFADYMS